MTNLGSQGNTASVISLVQLVNKIKEGEIKLHGYKSSSDEWLRFPSGTSGDPIYVDVSGSMPDEVDITKVNGNTITVNAGNAGDGTPRVTLATDDINTAAINSGVGATDDAAATAGSVGSLNAKLRLLTSDIDAIKTAAEKVDDAAAAEGVAATKGVQILLDNGATGIFAQSDANGYLRSINMPHPVDSDTWAQLTAVGSTDPATVTGYLHHTIQYVVAAINTNVVVRAEGSLDGTNWINLDADNSDTVITANGTYGMCFVGTLQSLRFTIVSEDGGTDVTVDAKYQSMT